MTENPPAFPSAAIDDKFGGMSLRDYFAGQAVSWSLETSGDNLDWGNRNKDFPDKVARRAYAIADAMLAARTPPGEKP